MSNWRTVTRSALGHCMPLCVTPPVLPSALQVFYCPVCHQLRVYQLLTKLICEVTPAERELEKACEVEEHIHRPTSTPTAKTPCGNCCHVPTRKQREGEHKPLTGSKKPVPDEDNTRYGREMYRRFPDRMRTDKAVGADLRYHGEHYDG